MAVHRVRLKDEAEGIEQSIMVEDDQCILDVAEEAGMDIRATCRSGECSSCVGKIVSGSVDQSGQSFLNDDHIDAGYVLLCVAYPQSDLTIEMNKEGELR